MLTILVNFAMYFVWAGAEIAVAMVCLGIPTLRPLYLKQRGMSIGYSDRAHTHNSDPELPMFTMCENKPPTQPPQTPQTPEKPVVDDSTAVEATNHKMGEIEEEQQGTQSDEPGYDLELSTFLRDSASSHTMVESSPSPEPEIQRPERARTRERSDSVDDILGLYDSDRSRSRGRAKVALHDNRPSTSSGVIVVKHEIWVDVERQAGDWPFRT